MTSGGLESREEPLKPDEGKSRKKISPEPGGLRNSPSVPTIFERYGNTLVLMTIGSVLLAAIFGVGIISPLFFTAAVFPFFYTAIVRNDHRAGVVIVFRWAIALFVTLLVVGVFVPDRIGSALPMATNTATALETWIRDPGVPPPANLNYILWGMLAFTVASVLSGGLLGFLIGAVALGGAAYSALHVFRHGINIIQISLVAVPVWQLSLFVAGAFVMVPLSVFMYERFFNVEKRPQDWDLLRNYMYVGASFFVLSIVLRYATAGVWRELVEQWTIL